MIWWYWVVLGLALTAIELATPGGFFFIFFAVSALLIGLVEQAILAVASATAEGIRQVATAIRTDGGMEAVQLRVAEQYVEQFGQLARQSNTVIIPATVSDISGMIASAMKVFGSVLPNRPAPPPATRT